MLNTSLSTRSSEQAWASVHLALFYFWFCLFLVLFISGPVLFLTLPD